jgi:hypothetical protein
MELQEMAMVARPVLPMLVLRSLAVLLALAAACSAHATTVPIETVPYSDTVLVQGTQLDVVELFLDGPGTYTVTATDLHWFDEPLAALSFGVFRPDGPIVTMQGAGTLEFFNAAAGNVFLQLYARADGLHDVGLVSLVVAPAVVPLPPPAALLGTALLVWVVAQRRRTTRPVQARLATLA